MPRSHSCQLHAVPTDDHRLQCSECGNTWRPQVQSEPKSTDDVGPCALHNKPMKAVMPGKDNGPMTAIFECGCEVVV